MVHAIQGRGKKDAKQVSAAAVLEMLLVNVPESDFLMPGKAKQTKTVQVSPAQNTCFCETCLFKGKCCTVADSILHNYNEQLLFKDMQAVFSVMQVS